jgi:hypothetical protein
VYLVVVYGQAWHLGLPSFFVKLVPTASVDLILTDSDTGLWQAASLSECV